MKINRFTVEVIVLTILGIGVMIWAATKFVSGHQQIGTDDWWLYGFFGLWIIGCGLIIFAAFNSISDTT